MSLQIVPVVNLMILHIDPKLFRVGEEDFRIEYRVVGESMVVETRRQLDRSMHFRREKRGGGEFLT